MSKKLFFNALSAAAIFGSLFFFNGCKDEETQPEEVITTVKITFTNTNLGFSQTFIWKDLDGAGGNNPTIDTIKLFNQVYGTSIEFLNESVSPAEDITAEIRTESNDHLVVYETSDGSEFVIQDKDAAGKNLGLQTKINSLTAGTGKTLKIKLLHQPDKNNASNLGGDVDVEVVFPMVIQ